MRVLRSYATLVFLFLYAPIAVIVVFSFSAGHSASDFHGFSLQWYATAAGNRFVKDALVHSLIIAAASSALATVVGTAAALVLPRIRGPFRVVFDALTYVAIMVPGIVIGIATLIALVTAFEVLNPTLAALWPGDPAASPQLHMGWAQSSWPTPSSPRRSSSCWSAPVCSAWIAACSRPRPTSTPRPGA